MDKTKSNEKAGATQIHLQSKEELFNIGEGHIRRGVTYKQSKDQAIFSAGDWRLTFQKDKSKNLTLNLKDSSEKILMHLETEEHPTDCLISLIRYVANRDGLTLSEDPDGIKKKVAEAKELPVDPSCTTRTFLVPEGKSQNLINYVRISGSARGYFSIMLKSNKGGREEVVFPFKISTDKSKTAEGYTLSFGDSSQPGLIEHTGLPKSTVADIAMPSVLSLAKFVTEKNGWRYTPPGSGSDASSLKR